MICSFNVVKDIIIPLVAALIGGGLTLIGVLVTIRHENKKRCEEKILSNKPYIYLINPLQKYDDNAIDYVLTNDEVNSNKRDGFILKNTDNAILIIESLVIDGIEYLPKYGNVVDKNKTAIININNVIPRDDSSIVLTIKDSLKNVYKYKLSHRDNKSKYLDSFEEIESNN